ncbi:unnamed protein product [Miscanthus lutarioriparius]|uniref:Uncharacterized protein n=1 Tax=Miscanthus lutarioriparius TaxID=422564 RepID=A0A811SC52_9POAL|nr:unnamed protein product [Miscanthus lutarioriparius]
MRHSREVFMAGQPPQIPMPNPPDIQDGDEALSDISPDTVPPNGETNEQKTAREKKNNAQQAWCNRAQHPKEEWQWYQSACRDVERRRLAVEAAYERLWDEEAERQCQDHDAARASASRNLEPEFMEVAGHMVFTMPYANVYPLVEEMAAIENPTPNQQ